MSLMSDLKVRPPNREHKAKNKSQKKNSKRPASQGAATKARKSCQERQSQRRRRENPFRRPTVHGGDGKRPPASAHPVDCDASEGEKRGGDTLRSHVSKRLRARNSRLAGRSARRRMNQ